MTPEFPTFDFPNGLAATVSTTDFFPVLDAPTPLEVARQGMEPFRKKALDFEAKALAIKVTSEVTQTSATALAGEVKKAAKAVEDTRKQSVTPLNEIVRDINALAKEISAPLEKAEAYLKNQLTHFATQQELERRKEEERRRQEAAAEQARLNAEAAAEQNRLNAEAKAKGLDVVASIQAPLVPEVVVEAAPSTVRTASGSSFLRTTWTFEVVDLASVPREFLILDEKQVNASIKAGVREIQGIRIFEKQTAVIK